LNSKNLAFEYLPGEGAFYGPKIEFTLKDCLGRLWQCGTLQIDPNLPERLGAEYVGEDNAKHRPIMLHRAVLGSLERFIGILIENHAGAFPAWLAPVQLVVMNISESQREYAQKTADLLNQSGLRASTDLRNEKITYKIREHSLQRLPYQLIVGDKERDAGLVAVRNRSGEDLGQMTVEALIALVKADLPKV
ncbi:MAG: His/Gly/Thr/Pro-type tRNA ligase C-terminal domain-containing protein, partial [Deefgea sp.]